MGYQLSNSIYCWNIELIELSNAYLEKKESITDSSFKLVNIGPLIHYIILHYD